MAPLDVAVLLGLALGGLVEPFQTFRINYKNKDTSSAGRKTIGKCCNITEGILYDSRTGEVPIQGRKCKQRLYRAEYKTRIIGQIWHCRTGKYPSWPLEPHVDVLKVEALENKLCQSAPWCTSLSLSKCYKITEGELSPWNYAHNVNSQQDFPSGMAISVSGKICQRGASVTPPETFTLIPRSARLKINAVEMLRDEECEGDKWKHHGLGAAPACDDFGFWKQVLSTEGIKAPNWMALIAEAKVSSPEGMAWGTTMSDEEAEDTLWNARRDTVLRMDRGLSSWS